MNNAKKEMIKREKRNQAIAESLGWFVLAVGGFLCAKAVIKGLELFFGLYGIHWGNSLYNRVHSLECIRLYLTIH